MGECCCFPESLGSNQKQPKVIKLNFLYKVVHFYCIYFHLYLCISVCVPYKNKNCKRSLCL